jgi:uncharacterized protein (DUF1778 family)
MATVKEQLNVQVTAATKQLAKTCATVRRTSLNAWVENAIQEKADRDNKTFNIDAMNKALKKVAKQYLPGKAATHDQMLAMAQRVAAEDTVEGFTVEHYPESPPAPKRAPNSTRFRRR